MKWRKVKVGDFLIRVKDLVPIEKDKEYSLVTIKLYHKGIQPRKKVNGSQIQANKMSRVKAGQFILSGIDARNGAFGIIPDELDGAVVTNDFWHFDIDKNIMSDEYFLWLTSTPYFDDICKKASDGTTNRIRLQSDRFYSQELLIPEIQDQDIVVEELKRTSSKIKVLKSEYKFQLTLIENLNQAILQEAVQGKLVKQDKRDEPSSKLLKRIKAEKLKSGKKEKSLLPIKSEEIPFEIPGSWMWCRLGEIIEMIYGDGLTKAQCIEGASYPVFGSNGIVGYYNKYLTDKRTIIVGRKGSAGALNLCQIPSWTTDVAYYIEESEFLDFDFAFYLLKSLQLENLGKGIKPGVNRNEVYNIPIPLSPLPEQKRIVAEIEKQFAQTKQLKDHVIANQLATEHLLKALLYQAFEVKRETEETFKQAKVVEYKSSNVTFDALVASPFEYYIPHPVNNIQDINWELAMMVACIENKLGIGYGDVGLQKNVFNASVKQPIFSKHYSFINSNFGTYSFELKEDLNSNPYLTKRNFNGKEVYTVTKKHQKQVLNKLTAPENKSFVQTLDTLLSIYEHPFINKETDKIELFNTVLKVALDKKCKDLDTIYQGMKDWKIKQEKFKTKAEKFSKPEVEQMLKLLIVKKVLNV